MTNILIFIIIILGIIGYFWYRSSPAIQFMRAMSLLDNHEVHEASIFFESLFDKHSQAPAKLAECKLKQGLEYLSDEPTISRSFFENVLDIKRHLPSGAQKKAFAKMEAVAHWGIAQINFNNLVLEKTSQSKLNRLYENLQYIEKVPKTGFENEFADLNQKHVIELAGLYYFFGMNKERESEFSEAIQLYSKVCNLANISFDTAIKSNAMVRMGICKLKNKKAIDEDLFEEINYASENIKTDFCFRYAKSLIREKDYQEAEKIINHYLNFDSPIIEKLKNFIRSNKLEEATTRINKINYTLEKLYENAFPIIELKDFYDTLDADIRIINSFIPSASEKLNQLKSNIFNRLLINYIEENKFANAINLIQKYPFFWENPELLKNLGICCYGYTSQGNMEESNYKIIISYYLTAVYSDKVMLKSVEQTNRSDNYTYTLIESIGSKHNSREMLPDNVNYDPVSETNISIGATQKELLGQFESLLYQKINNPALINTIHTFFSSEKAAMERIIINIDKDILFASPYFAKAFNLNETIIVRLDETYGRNKNEEALEAGIPYLREDSDTRVGEFALAKELLDKAGQAIQHESVDELKSINTYQDVTLINKYDKVNVKAEDFLFNSIASKIGNSYDNDNLIPLMEEAIKFSSKNKKLKHQCAYYITNYCTNKINAGIIDNWMALSLMETAYLYSPDNPRICKNFITLIKFNLRDILNDRTKNAEKIYNLLDQVYLRRSATFKQESAELSNVRNDLLSQLPKTGVDLLNDNYGFQTGRQSLNAQGERMKKVLSYFKKLSEN